MKNRSSPWLARRGLLGLATPLDPLPFIMLGMWVLMDPSPQSPCQGPRQLVQGASAHSEATSRLQGEVGENIPAGLVRWLEPKVRWEQACCFLAEAFLAAAPLIFLAVGPSLSLLCPP